MGWSAVTPVDALACEGAGVSSGTDVSAATSLDAAAGGTWDGAGLCAPGQPPITTEINSSRFTGSIMNPLAERSNGQALGWAGLISVFAPSACGRAQVRMLGTNACIVEAAEPVGWVALDHDCPRDLWFAFDPHTQVAHQFYDMCAPPGLEGQQSRRRGRRSLPRTTLDRVWDTPPRRYHASSTRIPSREPPGSRRL